jgi:hypothetical protein
MATNYPASLDTLTNPNPTDTVDVVSHSDQHANANDSIEALEAKVGIDGSAVTTTHDYKLSGVTGADKSASLTGSETLTNKTLTAPVLSSPDINTPDIDGGTIDDVDITNPTLNGTVQLDLGTDATGDIYYRNAGGELTRLPIGSDAEVLTTTSGLPSWEVPSTGSGVRVRAYKSTSQTLATVNVEEKVTFDTEEYDTGADFTSSTFTTPAAGNYLLDVNLNMLAQRPTQLRVKVNGSEVRRIYAQAGAGTVDTSLVFSGVLVLSSADTVEVFSIYTGTTGTNTIQSGITESAFSIIQL